MRNGRAFLVLMLAAVASAVSVVAAPPKSCPVGSGPKGSAPAEFASQIDGPIATSAGPGGRTWAAWAYRAAGEFDVAIAFRDGGGPWSAPSYLGRRDWLDEIDPTIAVDRMGTVYVAFATRGSGRVALSALTAGASTWFEPVVVSGTEQASAPAIRIVGDHVVVAYRTAAGIRMADIPIRGAAEVDGIQDGPDGVDPVGIIPKWGDDGIKRDSDPPSQ